MHGIMFCWTIAAEERHAFAKIKSQRLLARWEDDAKWKGVRAVLRSYHAVGIKPDARRVEITWPVFVKQEMRDKKQGLGKF